MEDRDVKGRLIENLVKGIPLTVCIGREVEKRALCKVGLVRLVRGCGR